MKKFFYSVLAATTMLFATTSCSQDNELVNDETSGEATQSVTFTIETGTIASRTAGDGQSVNQLHYEVWTNDNALVISSINGRNPKVKYEPVTIDGGKATVNLRLVKNVAYDITFWAQVKDGNVYKITNGLDKITYVDATQLLSNKESYDAFYQTLDDFKVFDGSTTVKLRRPFAQINVGTTEDDYEAAKALGVNINKSTVTIDKVCNTFNARTRETTGETTLTFGLNDILQETFQIRDENNVYVEPNYQYLGMNYLFADSTAVGETVSGKTLHTMTIALNDGETTINTLKVVNMPMQRNWRTNIVGNLLTSNEEFQIIIDPEFDGDYNTHIWDGESIHKPGQDEDGNWIITTAAELAWVSAATVHGVDYTVHGSRASNGHSFYKQTIKLAYDIDLNGKEWAPIGVGGEIFRGNFDGQGHTISNMVINPAEDNTVRGFFGNVGTATISNLTIDNAKVDAGKGGEAYAGALVGRSYGTLTLENVTIKNSVVKGTTKIGGIVGFIAEGKIIADNCKVIDTDITTHDVDNESGLAGGFIGYIASEDNEINNCSVSDGVIKVKNSRKNADRANSAFIGAIGGTGSIKLNNCTAEPFYFNQPGGLYNSETGESYTSPYGPYNAQGSVHALIGGNRGTAKVYINGNEIITQTNLDELVKVEGANIKLYAGTYSIPTDIADGVTIKATESVTYLMGGIGLEVNNFTLDGGIIKGSNTTKQTTLTLTGNNNTIKNVEFTFTGGNGVALDVNDSDVNSVTVIEGINFGTEDSFRNIGWAQIKGKLYVKDCEFTDGVYNVHIDSGNNTAELIVENSKLYGLTTLGNSLKKATFIDCEMDFVNGYNAFWLRSDAEFIRCKFAKKDDSNNYSENGYGITAASQDENNYVLFTNCTYMDGSAINYVNTEAETAPLINVDNDSESWMWVADGILVSGNATNIDNSTENPVDVINKALSTGGNVILSSDVQGPATGSNAYGTTNISQENGGIIDGGGHTITTKGANGTWDSAINTTGGTIKNLTIDSGFRGIFINHNSTVNGKVYLENVIIDGTTYTISCDQGTNNGLEATNCTFNGWTSYAATLGEAIFIGCNFGEGNGYAFCRPYAPTTFKNCNFEQDYKMDPRAAVIFENCYLGGIPLTNDNLAALVTSNIANATVK